MSSAAELHRRSLRLTFTRRIVLMALIAGFPAVCLTLALLWTGNFSDRTRWTLTILAVGFWAGACLAIRRRLEMPLQTLSNLLLALREGDYSVRARRSEGDDPLAEVMREANAIIGLMRDQRMNALDATALLRKVIEEIDAAIFAFDANDRLRLVNPAGAQLLAQPSERLLGAGADEIGLKSCLEGEARRVEEMSFPGGPGSTARWGISRTLFRQGGLPMQLLVISDLRRALREEELQAWQRLVRVLGHEINNSLTPIRSISASLESLLRRSPRPGDWEDEAANGLRVIGGRAEALSRFTIAYASLAKLPKPALAPVDVGAWVRRTAAMETRLSLDLRPGPETVISADADQLEQLLINLIRNATDASLETGGAVRLGWRRNGRDMILWIEDEGPGIANPANLFVPFFTTKPRGAGIGLVLSRQIAEAHGGTLTLENRSAGRGARAQLKLPLAGTKTKI